MSSSPKSFYDQYVELKNWSDRSIHQEVEQETAYYFAMEMERVPFWGKGTRVLEIGFGEGLFLDWAAQQGAIVTGVELLPELCAHASKRHDAIFQGSLDVLVQEGSLQGPFDLIVAFDVFEHLGRDELVSYLQSFSKILTNRGCILARFPNGYSPFGRIHQHGDLTHQNALTPYSMKQLGLMTGFSLRSVYNAARSASGSPLKKLRWKAIYGLRDVAEYAIGYLYFSARLPLDPNLTIIMEKVSEG